MLKKKKKKRQCHILPFLPSNFLESHHPLSLLPTGREERKPPKQYCKSYFKYKKNKTLLGNLQRASALCSCSVMFTGFVSADSVSDERIFTVPSCYLFVCKVGKLPFKTPASFWCPSLHLLFKVGKEKSEGRRLEEGSNTSPVIEVGSPSLLLCTPLVPHRSCSPSVTNSHCRGSALQFPDLVGCILLCKHSP